MVNDTTYKHTLIIVIFLFLISFFVMRISVIFRMNEDLNWIYGYSHLFYFFIVFPLITIFTILNPLIILKNFLNPIIVIKNNKISNRIIWIIIGLIPLFFHLIIPLFNENFENLNLFILKKYFPDCRPCFYN